MKRNAALRIPHIPKICPQPEVDRVPTLSSLYRRCSGVNYLDGGDGGDGWRADVSCVVFFWVRRVTKSSRVRCAFWTTERGYRQG